MNKPIKAKNLPLFSIMTWTSCAGKNIWRAQSDRLFHGKGWKSLSFMEQPSETQGKDWLSTPSTYTAVEIQLDWANSGCWKRRCFLLPLEVPVSLFAARR